MLKFVFEEQDYQKEAVNAVTGLFMSEPRDDADYSSHTGIIGNRLLSSGADIQKSLDMIQSSLIQSSKISEKTTIESQGMDFTVEMETGTGKTYVYIRTILELARLYGWRKYIIVVPSLPIKEGVLKTFQMTREHFRTLPDLVSYNEREYDSKKLQILKDFARSDGVEILIMTMWAINKDLNTINKYIDSFSELVPSGKPIDMIAETRPILILDEPQNMEWEQTKKWLVKLNPLFTLRYSATHREPHNPVHILWPNDAYQKWLVKQIEVVSVVEDDSIGDIEISLVSTTSKWSKITASVECFVAGKNEIPKKKIITLKMGDDLADKSGLSLYAGWLVENIAIADDWGNLGWIVFSNGNRITEWARIWWEKTELLKFQIETAVKEHFRKRNFLRTHNIKPLSLFFIDKVANYVETDGIIRQLFLTALDKENRANGSPIADIQTAHNGYFSKKKDKWEEIFLDTKWDSASDKDTYDLIMRDKERLLSQDEPVEFIFSHSALGEWWDNPNVFTLATLREGWSTIRMRQELGRGMRLCVDGSGVRIRTLPDGKNPNILTVVPTISYKNFAETLQGQYRDAGYNDVPPPENAKKRATIKRKRDYKNDTLLMLLWEKISKKSIYSISIESSKMIWEIVAKINVFPSAYYQKKVFTVGEKTRITTIWEEVSGDTRSIWERINIIQKRTLDNPLESLARKTGLSRTTLSEILSQISNKVLYTKDPEKYISDCINTINQVKDRIQVEEIRYKTTWEKYTLDDFAHEIDSYENKVLKISEDKQNKTIYDGIIYDSAIEMVFAKELIDSSYIRYFLKLPDWFKIETPVLGWSTYNPDWAILASRDGTDENMKLYFVIETKSSTNEDERRWWENQKIECWKRHFHAIDEDLKYHDLTDFEMLKNLIIG